MVTALTVRKGRDTMSDVRRQKRVKVSKQRQITIPKEYYEALNLTDEAMVEFTGNEIIIRPAEQEYVDFSSDILKDLVSQGYEGDELIVMFDKIKADIPNALRRMTEDVANKNPLNSIEELDALLDAEELDEDEE
ncbi:AbrB/MazE/SpoVT family DNA-binding domain-containing protein [Caldifermentibacillus hisashii]|uniref:AbrB/MazE/SpoVT family DNA-binding domain-containing protein n=1 Tax=Caldifermentibacillus hisashii TaxID=996558 RepID=UPI0031012745